MEARQPLWRRALSWAASLALAAALVPTAALAPVAAWADEDEAQALPTTTISSYITSDGTSYTDVYVLGSSSGTTTYAGGALSAGTYVLDGDVEVNDTLTVNDVVTTIELNGHVLSCVSDTAIDVGSVKDTSCTLTVTSGSDGGAVKGVSKDGVINVIGYYDGIGLILDGYAKVTGNTTGPGIKLSLAALTMKGNSSVGGNYNSATYGGGVYTTGTNASSTTFTMEGNASVTNNTTTYAYGGGVYVQTYVSFSMASGCSISGNTVSYSSSGSGGGLYLDGKATGGYTGSGISTTTISGTISDNTVGSGSGGGLYVIGSSSSTGSLTLSGATITGNIASTSGGGLYASRFPVTLSDCTVSDNIASGYGGGIYSSPKKLTICGTTSIKDNSAGSTTSSLGGGVYAVGTLVLGGSSSDSVSVSGNNAYAGAACT